VSTSAWQPSGTPPQVAAGAPAPGAPFGVAAHAAHAAISRISDRIARIRAFTPPSSQIRRRLSVPADHSLTQMPTQIATDEVPGSQLSVPSSTQVWPSSGHSAGAPAPQATGSQMY
jgi:hypothetical protein